MPNRTDYLADLTKHPGSLAVEVQTRLGAPTVNAVETQFRKLEIAGLVAVEDSRPRKYRLTEKGEAEVGTVDAAAPSDAPDSPQTEDAGLLSKVLAPLFRSAIRSEVEAALKREQSASDSQTGNTNAGRVTALLEKAKRLADPEEAEAATAQSNLCLRELLGIERGLSELPRRELRELRDSLREKIADEGLCEKVARLVEAEAKLSEQNDGWWSDQNVVKQLEEEIAGLKKELGLPEETEEADAAATDEEG